MSQSQTETFAPVGQVSRRPTVLQRTHKAVWECLVVSATSKRRKMLAEAARAGGWQTVPFADTRRALSYIEKKLIHLALVDIETGTELQLPELRFLSETLVQQDHLLLVICGRETAAEEETWARQLGTWLYLPGVGGYEGVASLCQEARHITEQLNAPCPPGRHTGHRATSAATPAAGRIRRTSQ